MEATGLKKGGIYRHFESKEELAAEAFWETVWKTRRLRVDERASGIDKLKQLIANFIERRSPVAGGCPVLNTAVDADDGNPVLRTRVVKALRTLRIAWRPMWRKLSSNVKRNMTSLRKPWRRWSLLLWKAL